MICRGRLSPLFHTKYRNSSINFKIEPVEMFIDYISFLHNVINGFCKFQNHIAGKSFAYIDIGLIGQKIPALDISYKINTAIFFQKRVGSLGKQISFALFFTKIYKPTLGFGIFKICFANNDPSIANCERFSGLQSALSPTSSRRARCPFSLRKISADGRAKHSFNRFNTI